MPAPAPPFVEPATAYPGDDNYSSVNHVADALVTPATAGHDADCDPFEEESVRAVPAPAVGEARVEDDGGEAGEAGKSSTVLGDTANMSRNSSGFFQGIKSSKYMRSSKEKKPISELAPLEFSGRFAGGLRADLLRRVPLYVSDWTEAFTGGNCMKTTASICFLFFACLSPAVTFGAAFADATDNQLGVIETIISSGMSGLIYSFLSGQPLCILGATGPELAFTVCTRFTEEIFSFLISIIFIVGAFTTLIKLYLADPDVEGDDPAAPANRAKAFLGTLLGLFTYFTAMWCRAFPKRNEATPLVRKLVANYGVTLSILLYSGINYGFRDVDVPCLDMPDEIVPTATLNGTGESRGWFVNPFGDETASGYDTPGVGFIFFTAVPALGLAVLGYLDQNLTTLLINRKDHNLKKGGAYHLDLLVCGIFIYPICGFFGLPFTHAATVRSMSHLMSLMTREDSKNEHGQTVSKVTNVVEQRVTHLGIHCLLLAALGLSAVLTKIPKVVLAGVFLYMGVTALPGVQLYERLWLWLIWDTKKYPQYDYVTQVARKPLHLYTLFQFSCLAVLYALTKVPNPYISVIFPFFIAFLPLIRKLVPKCFPSVWSKEDLKALDK
ncbi:hypothetical protein EMIHUDRAFT_200137 [Emiliania huxleyi CCMP1516]|uniref:Bicarbonate transporter-like transmembrane domain-containing protein n=2 Tax=Emiliania huxleyi TaxID=2903 RepID=A0A0D3KV10_EMIH1|nr:hypothetical protein EMIHUDRAFT_200137 [Emiliania huxleyi CCMP1516]EOD39595.1 hypothetical protein EMIHUDRAFT_200137 [Emiliania huxleyi CCMP1516]|eukprot:XP_005792024.1 hypothetical protein EMIHUDRAFT_200137 [Emiliania huxleyi CCMP1516]